MNLSHLRYRFIIVTRFFTIKRFLNLLLNQYEFLSKKTVLKSFPRSLSLELVNYCNLYCIACPTHIHSSQRKKEAMNFLAFSNLIDKFKKVIFNVEIGANGECTLVPKVEKYIGYLNKNRIFSLAETNFNCSKEIIKKMFFAGISMFNVSLDGISQKSYGVSKKGGDYKKVYDNLVYLCDLKKKNKSIFPRIKWQFIVNKYNENEIFEAMKMAKEIGVDEFSTDLSFVPGGDRYFFEDDKKTVEKLSKEFIPLNQKYAIKKKTDFLTCYQPFSEMHILSNGAVIPCCRLREVGFELGNVFKSEIKAIWNNSAFIYFRRQLIAQGKQPDCKTCANNAKLYNKQR